MYKSGANFSDRNRIKKMLREGEHTHEQIRALTKVNLQVIQNIEDELDDERLASTEDDD